MRASVFSKSALVAYFSMEVGIDPSMPTYSGGLGILAGDTLRAVPQLTSGQTCCSLTRIDSG